jgi:hypothetical protein
MKQLHRWLTNGLMHHCLEHPDIGLFISAHPDRKTTTAEIQKIRKAGNKNPEGRFLIGSLLSRIDLIGSLFRAI